MNTIHPHHLGFSTGWDKEPPQIPVTQGRHVDMELKEFKNQEVYIEQKGALRWA